MMKKFFAFVLSLTLALCLAACGQADKPQSEPLETTSPPSPVSTSERHAYTSRGLTFVVPDEYVDLLIVDMPQEDEDGTVFSVFEKASYEAGVTDGHDESEWRDGWLFTLSQINRAALDEMMTRDMSGVEVFARDSKGNYYVFLHPTDVRFYRSSEFNESDTAQWTELNEWAFNKVQDSLIAENKDLAGYTVTNTELDIYLARLACGDDIAYTISTSEFGPLTPDGVDAAPYVARLRKNAMFVYSDESVVPDDEVIALDFYDDGVRFEFFYSDGYEYVRRIYDVGYEKLYRAYHDGAVQATDILREWYDALTEAQGIEQSG